jgi:ABC-type lipoprotein export system ATPase subunit
MPIEKFNIKNTHRFRKSKHGYIFEEKKLLREFRGKKERKNKLPKGH